MIVMITAITESLKASSRLVPVESVELSLGVMGNIVPDELAQGDDRHIRGRQLASYPAYTSFTKAKRSAFMVSACVVGMPCGNPL